MKIFKINSQSTTAFLADLICEYCGNVKINVLGYDDDFFHEKIMPIMKCEKCGSKTRNKGKQLKFAREYRGYTQTELCKCIRGLSQSNLSKYENGFDNTISNVLLAEIMKHLDWPLTWLDKKPININFIKAI